MFTLSGFVAVCPILIYAHVEASMPHIIERQACKIKILIFGMYCNILIPYIADNVIQTMHRCWIVVYCVFKLMLWPMGTRFKMSHIFSTLSHRSCSFSLLVQEKQQLVPTMFQYLVILMWQFRNGSNLRALIWYINRNFGKTLFFDIITFRWHGISPSLRVMSFSPRI